MALTNNSDIRAADAITISGSNDMIAAKETD
jgi:hypothetical protein